MLRLAQASNTTPTRVAHSADAYRNPRFLLRHQTTVSASDPAFFCLYPDNFLRRAAIWLVDARWFVLYYLLLTTYYLLLTTHYVLLTTDYFAVWLVDARWFDPLILYYLLLTTYTTHYLLLTTYYLAVWLLDARWFDPLILYY